MKKILIGTTAVLFSAGIALAQSSQPTQPVPQKDNPRVEQNEKNKNSGNVENQNQQDIKAKEQAPTTKKN